MAAPIDALTSPTLKYLREQWWTDEFSTFLRDTLRPRPGNRILDVGCGAGEAEVRIGRLHLSQIRLHGVDLLLDRLINAKYVTSSHNQSVHFAAGDARRLPFRDGSFDSTYCVAVLQHVDDLDGCLCEFVRVTRPGGRILAVEPDNSAPYWYTSVPSGPQVWDARQRFFAAYIAVTTDHLDRALGPQLSAQFAAHGVEPLSVRIFPAAHTELGAPTADTWQQRRRRVQVLIDHAAHPEVDAAGRHYLEALAIYQAEADAAGASFIELQNTLLFATVGQKL